MFVATQESLPGLINNNPIDWLAQDAGAKIHKQLHQACSTWKDFVSGYMITGSLCNFVIYQLENDPNNFHFFADRPVTSNVESKCYLYPLNKPYS